MKLYLDNFSVSVDLSLDDVVGISLDANQVYFIHSDSTVTSFINGQISAYRFGFPINFSDESSLLDYFNNSIKNGKGKKNNGLQKENEKKLVSEKFPKRSWCKKSKLGR